MTSYDSAVSSMSALGHELAGTPSNKFDLAHMRLLLSALGDPQATFPAVLIAGTNGKGSTAATLASILCAAGYRTGLYTSPHLVRLNERIRILAKPGSEANAASSGMVSGTVSDTIGATISGTISDDAFAAAHAKVDDVAERLVAEGVLPWHPSFFEMMTAIAFVHFASATEGAKPIDIAVLEVGLGGRLDATNVAGPLISILADIALDHQQWLGNTIGEIAREKCGIIREGGVVVTLPQLSEANDVIGKTIMEHQARGVSAVQFVPPVSPNAAQVWDRQSFSPNGDRDQRGDRPPHTNTYRYPLQWQGTELLVETPLIGRHQLRNVALALAAADELTRLGFPVAPAQVEQGVRETQWPGRFQLVRGASLDDALFTATDSATADFPELANVPAHLRPDFLFDVAHNPAGAWALRSALSERFEDQPFTLIFGAMRDKAIGEMAEVIFPVADRILTATANNPRAATGDEIRTASGRLADRVEAVHSIKEALHAVMEPSSPPRLVVVSGSIYIVGEALRVLRVRL